jgi:hypothetical protein
MKDSDTGEVITFTFSDKDRPLSTRSQVKWNDTGITLVLSILDSGKQGKLYLVKDAKLPYLEATETSDPIWHTLGIDSFTLATVTGVGRSIKLGPYEGLSHDLDLKITSQSHLELTIVQTGMKGKWSEGHPPIGLYRID